MTAPRLVLKFGGTSMANPERIAHSASIVAAEARAGKQVAVVVSAMAGETDRLLGAAEFWGNVLTHGLSRPRKLTGQGGGVGSQ